MITDMEKNVICVVDRIEEGIAVCFADNDGTEFSFSIAALGFVREGDAVSLTVTVQNGQETVIRMRPATMEEHADQKTQNAKRLRRLFDKHKE